MAMKLTMRSCSSQLNSSVERRSYPLAIHVALNHPSDAALIEASNSPSLTNCPISADDIANARVIYGQCKDCAEG
jgi:hypothetical protein